MGTKMSELYTTWRDKATSCVTNVEVDDEVRKEDPNSNRPSYEELLITTRYNMGSGSIDYGDYI